MTTVKNIYDFINSIAPYNTQEDWDNSGHLVGDFRKSVTKVVMALDTTKSVCDFASDVNADLVLTHHPIIFSGLKSVHCDSAVYKLVNNDIAHLCAHTNFDIAKEGINHNLAQILELKNITPIENSFIAVGELENAMSMDDFAEYVNEKLNCHGIRYTDSDRIIKKVSVGGGACGEFVNLAKSYSDCFVTGDLKYHEMLDAYENDFPVISAGHYETENVPFMMLKSKLQAVFTDVEFITAPVDNPVLTVY